MADGFYKRWFDHRWPAWAAKVVWLLSRLVRTRMVGQARVNDYEVVTFAHWHGDEMGLMPNPTRHGVTVLVSHSKDGRLMARACEAMGYRVTRGSSSRGAVGGLVALIKAVRQGHSVVLAVDGPNGPRGVCKPGIVKLAQKTGAPLFPVAVAGTRRYVFEKTWNKVYLPLPFSRQVIVWGEPLFFDKTNAAAEIEGQCRRVEEAIEEAGRRAEEVLRGGER